MKRARKLLTKKEIPSYQLALRCLSWCEANVSPRRQWRGNVQLVKELAREIRAYRSEERKVN